RGGGGGASGDFFGRVGSGFRVVLSISRGNRRVRKKTMMRVDLILMLSRVVRVPMNGSGGRGDCGVGLGRAIERGRLGGNGAAPERRTHMSLVPDKKTERPPFFRSKIAPWTTSATQIGTTSAAVTALDALVTAAEEKLAAQTSAEATYR